MNDWIEILRSKSIKERQFIALVGAGSIVGIMFLIWAATMVSGFGQIAEPVIVSDQKENSASVFDGAKRKIDLLFGENGAFSNIGKPIEYKQDSIE